MPALMSNWKKSTNSQEAVSVGGWQNARTTIQSLRLSLEELLQKEKKKDVSPALPLVVREVHGTDAGVTARVDVKLFEVTRLPHLHHSVVTTCHQVLAVTAQQDRLKREKEAAGR